MEVVLSIFAILGGALIGATLGVIIGNALLMIFGG